MLVKVCSKEDLGSNAEYVQFALCNFQRVDFYIQEEISLICIALKQR